MTRVSTPPAFSRYIGIDYSGAGHADASLRGLRAYMAHEDALPHEVLPPPGRRKYWSRRGLAEWLIHLLGDQRPTLVGMDHGFSFPLPYFKAYLPGADWPAFLDDFQFHWPTHLPDIRVEDLRRGNAGHALARSGKARWRRLTEVRCRAKSVFHFDVQGSVAKSTHAGLPWLRQLRLSCPDAPVHCWPFDGWHPAPGRSVVAEVYPALWSQTYPRDGRSPDQHDAFTIARHLSGMDRAGLLPALLSPALTATEKEMARLEGWILGVL